jgi:imidazolonepropionase-like amidohydrolase
VGLHNAQTFLNEGFTTLRDSFARGLFQGPRMVIAGSCVSVTGGHGDNDFLAPNWALRPQPNIADTVDQIAVVVRRDLKYGADWIKLMASGGVGDVISDYNVQDLSEAQMAKAVEVAHRARRPVMAHAEESEGIKAAVRAGVDSIEHGTMLDEEGATLMEQRGTWLVPTLYTFQLGVEVGLTHGADPVALAKDEEILKTAGKRSATCCRSPGISLLIPGRPCGMTSPYSLSRPRSPLVCAVRNLTNC